MTQLLLSKTACLREFLLISTALGAALPNPLPSAENCSGPRTAEQFLEMTFGPGSGYGPRTRPSEAFYAMNKSLFADLAPPEDVQIRMNILQVNYVDDKTQSFKIFVMQSAAWVDWRLRWPKMKGQKGCMARGSVEFKTEDLQGKQWMPDVYVVNSAKTVFLKGHCIIRLNGIVYCTNYYSYVLTCSMDFGKMPFDEQYCPIEMRVMAGTSKEVKISPIASVKPLGLPTQRVGTIEWSLAHADVTTDILQVETHEETRVFFNLSLKREPGFYVKEVIIPTIGIILICWLSFFVSASAVPARCAVTVIAFLTLTNKINGITSLLPRLASDVWLLTFLSGSRWFAFVTILEYGMVNTLTRYEEALKKEKAAVQKKHKEDQDQLKQLEAVEYGMVDTLTRYEEALKKEKAAVQTKHEEDQDQLKQLEAGHSAWSVDVELVQRKVKASEYDIGSEPQGQQVPRKSPQMGAKSGKGREEKDSIASFGRSMVGCSTDVDWQQQQQQEQEQEQHQQHCNGPEKMGESMDMHHSRSVAKELSRSWHGACITQLLMTKDGNIRVSDITVDLFARWAYPITYMIFVSVMVLQI